MKNKKEKYLTKIEKDIMLFSDKSVGEVKDYLISCLGASYSTGAYHAVKEIFEARNEEHKSKVK